MSLDPNRTAVIATHFENDIVTENGAFGGFFYEQIVARDVIAKSKTLIDGARDAGATVVYTRVGWDAGYQTLVPNSTLLKLVQQFGALVKGTPQVEIVDALAPVDGDFVVTHERVSSFSDSPLDTILRGRGVDTILIFGVASNASVEDTARHGANLGYRVIFVEDACSAATLAAHEATTETMGLLAEVSTVEAVLAELNGADAASVDPTGESVDA